MRSLLAALAVLALASTAIGCAHSTPKPEPAPAPAPAPASPALRHDGVYRSEPVGSGSDAYWYYLRFDPNGTVYTASSTGTPEQIRPWFGTGTEADASRGTYRVEGGKIAFTSTSKSGSVEYEGEILDGALQLRSHSLINGFRSERRYAFVPDGAAPATP